jgi:hypothetical protein
MTVTLDETVLKIIASVLAVAVAVLLHLRKGSNSKPPMVSAAYAAYQAVAAATVLDILSIRLVPNASASSPLLIGTACDILE